VEVETGSLIVKKNSGHSSKGKTTHFGNTILDSISCLY